MAEFLASVKRFCIRVVLWLALLGIVGGSLTAAYSYFMYDDVLVVVTNTTVKRATEGAPDQYRVNYIPVENGALDAFGADLFRNEDAWFYFKWNSGTLDSRLAALPKGTVISARVYGWRIPYWSMMRNITSFKDTGQRLDVNSVPQKPQG